MYLALYENELAELYRRQAEWNRVFAMNCLDHESAGMDLADFKNRYMKSFTVMGGLDVQTTIGFGDYDRLKREIERVVRMFAEGWPDGWTTRTGKRLASFQIKWEAVIREWSVRWGTKIKGWWFDGCYFEDEMYGHPDAPNLASFAAAARSGNPDAILAFNPGIMLKTMGPEEDYTAGETAEPDKVEVPPGRWLDGEQVQIWSYLGKFWMQSPLRFTDDEAVAHTRRITANGAVMTWDIPLQENGVPSQEVVRQLSAIGQSLG